MSNDARSRAWVEVSASALRENAAQIGEIAGPDSRLLPVVKANAYGLGVERTVGELETLDPWGYGVETVEEGRKIRSLGVDRPILVLAPTPPGELEAAVGSKLRLAVSSLEALSQLEQIAARIDEEAIVHVEADTGMGRSGFDWEEVEDWGPDVLSRTGPSLRWEGVFSHFLSAGNLESDALTEQADRFAHVLRVLSSLREDPWIRHLCNSAGLLRIPESSMELVRPGIFLYGGRTWPGLPEPTPVVAVRARIVLIRDVRPGTTLGYGATYRASGEERWATLGIGYGDGIPRSLGDGGAVLIQGRRVPIIGRISMGVTVVDITNLPDSLVRVGDPVTLVGDDHGVRISLEEVARVANTISYEVLTGLSSRLPRVWL